MFLIRPPIATATRTGGGYLLSRVPVERAVCDDWRFNVGGFYRYDHGVHNPGFPGIRGGQLKGSVTRRLGDGYVRLSVKHIDDRNQFILPLPFADPSHPDYVSGFGNYGSFSTQEAWISKSPRLLGI